MSKRACIHRWVIPPADGRVTLPGVCSNCGVVRTFDATLADTAKKFRMTPRKWAEEHAANERAAFELVRGDMSARPQR